MKKKGYTSERLSFNRRMVAASASVTSAKNTIHSLAEVDITIPRKLMQTHFEETGEKLSFTGYIVYCLAQVLRDHPDLNSFIRGRKMISFDDVHISVLVEREFDGEKVPEPVCIKAAQQLTFREITGQIRESKQQSTGHLGTNANMAWVRLIPGFLLKVFIRMADRNLKMAMRYGKIAVTAVGMFSQEPIWFIPHGSSTVLITVGSIARRTEYVNDKPETREYLCLTGSFDHDIVDGAPAARFMNQFLETVRCGKYLAGLQH